MRTLLTALCLRRAKDDPAIAAQIALPPLSWHTRTLSFSAAERASYAEAMERFRRSHRAYARAAGSGGGGGAGRHGLRRKQALLGQLNGDLTRVRQTVCHPSVVNQARSASSERWRVSRSHAPR